MKKKSNFSSVQPFPAAPTTDKSTKFYSLNVVRWCFVFVFYPAIHTQFALYFFFATFRLI